MIYFFTRIVIYCGLSFLIAHFFGKERRNGFYWSLFFCILLSPLIGFLITLFSSKDRIHYPEKSNLKVQVGNILMYAFILGLFGSIMGLFPSNKQNQDFVLRQENQEFKYIGSETEYDYFKLIPIGLSIGFIGFGYFLVKVGKGENFNYKPDFEYFNNKEL